MRPEARRSRLALRAVPFLIVSAALSASGPALGPGLDWPILHRLPVTDSSTAVAVANDGSRAAVAEAPADPRGRGRILLFGGTVEPAALELPGRIRSMVFSDDGSRLYALQHRSRKKKRPGSTQLIVVDYARSRWREVMLVPEAARGVTLGADGASLLVACRDELRTVRLPTEQSGPLFRVPGEHRTVVALGGNRVLLGGVEGLLLVDLSDRPGEESMPVRQRAPTGSPVNSLALSEGGQRVRALLEDGSLIDIRLPGLTASAAGSASLLAAWVPAPRPELPAAPSIPPTMPAPSSVDSEPLSKTTPATPSPVEPSEHAGDEPAAPPSARPTEAPADPEPAPPVVRHEPRATQPATSPDDEAPPVLPPATPSAPADDARSVPAPPPPAAPKVQAPAARTEGTPRTPLPEEDETGTTTAKPPAEAAESDANGARVRGSVEGLPAGLSGTIVIFGPDNILREARRIALSRDGRWAASDLAPGRYRVQLDGGGKTVLVTDPPFLWVEVPPSGSVRTTPMRVIRAL